MLHPVRNLLANTHFAHCRNALKTKYARTTSVMHSWNHYLFCRKKVAEVLKPLRYMCIKNDMLWRWQSPKQGKLEQNVLKLKRLMNKKTKNRREGKDRRGSLLMERKKKQPLHWRMFWWSGGIHTNANGKNCPQSPQSNSKTFKRIKVWRAESNHKTTTYIKVSISIHYQKKLIIQPVLTVLESTYLAEFLVAWRGDGHPLEPV